MTSVDLGPIVPGPCDICGAVDYPLSRGGPAICPRCDSRFPLSAGPIPDLTAHLTDAEVDDLHAHLCAVTGVTPAEERVGPLRPEWFGLYLGPPIRGTVTSDPASLSLVHTHLWVPSTPGKHRRMLQDVCCSCGATEFGYPTHVGPACVMQPRVLPCDPNDPRPIWEQGLSTPGTADVGSHPPAPGLYASHERARGRLPYPAGPGAGTRRVVDALFYLPLIIVLGVLAGILFFGYTGDVDE